MRLCVLFLLFLCILPLQAAYYRSNILSQKLEEIPYPTMEGWMLVSEGNRETLFNNGYLESSKIIGDDVEIFVSGNRRRVVEFKSGRRSKETLEDGSEIHYEYSDSGLLKRALFIRSGKVEEIREYQYSPKSGLVSVYSTVVDRSYHGKDTFTFREDGKTIHVDIYPGNLLVREVLKKEETAESGPRTSAEVKEGGDIVIREKVGDDILETIYTESGEMKSEVVYSLDDQVVSRTDYSYADDGTLVSSVYTDSEERITRSYDGEGYLTFEKFEKNGETVKSRSYRSDGRIVERVFRGGRPYSEILLDKDGLRVLDLVLL